MQGVSHQQSKNCESPEFVLLVQRAKRISLTFKHHQRRNKSLPSQIILIGPEGDFSPKEIGLALSNHFIPVLLGEQDCGQKQLE